MSKPSALITGGASGIGLAVATHLISLGYRVAILDVSKEQGEAEAAKLGAECIFIHADVTDYSQLAHAFRRTYEWAEDRLDTCFLNAGVADTDAIYKEGELDEEGLPKPMNLKVFDVNLLSVVQGIRLFTHFARRKPGRSGKIVVTSSCVGFYPNYTIPLYAATKHGLVGLVRSAAPVLAAENITLNALCPVFIETGLAPKEYRHLWDKKQITPLSTAIKAYDAILNDDKINGQTIELALDELIFKEVPAYSTENTAWMFNQMKEWETITQPWMPREVGFNVKKAGEIP